MALKRPKGMTQFAWEAYQAASDAAGIPIKNADKNRVVQAYGTYVKSAGTHLYEPWIKEPKAGKPPVPNVKLFELNDEFYSAAADLSVKNLTHTQIATWIEELCRAGFVAFFRAGPVFSPHIHSVYAGVPMKSILRSQCEDFFDGKNGLVSHKSIENEFWCPSDELREVPKKMFKLSNGDSQQSVRSPIMEGKVGIEQPTYALFFNDEDKPRFHMPVIDGVALAPVRAWGTSLGFEVDWVPEKQSIQFKQKDGVVRDVPVAIKLIANVGHAPVRQLAAFSVLKLEVDDSKRKVTVSR